MKNILHLIIVCIICLCSKVSRSQQVVSEKLYVQTDRELYIPGETIWFRIFSVDASTLKPIDLSNIAYIEIIHESAPKAQAMIELKKGGGDGFIKIPEQTQTGTYQLRAYTNWMKNFGTKHFYQKNLTIISASDRQPPSFQNAMTQNENVSGMELQLSSAAIKRREHLNINFQLPAGMTKAVLSATIFLIDSASGGYSGSIHSLKENRPTGSFSNIRYLPEAKYHYVDALVRDTNPGSYAGDTAYLSVPGTTPMLYTARIDSAGRARFMLHKLIYGSHKIIVQVVHNNKHQGNIEVLSPYFDEYEDSRSINNRAEAIDINKRLIAQQTSLLMPLATDNLQDASLRTHHSNLKDTSMFYGKAPFTYMLDDFTRFPTMEEVLREYVIEVLVNRQGDKYSFTSISRHKDGLPVVYRPISLLNGVPVSANTVIKVDPLKINRIDIIPRRYFYGSSFFDGIISLLTYDGSTGEIEFDNGVLPVDYNGLQLSETFASPVYNSEQARGSRRADFRTTLQWLPFLKPDENGKVQFDVYSSDLVGKYMIVVEGIDESGNIISARKTFNVVK